MSTPMSPGSGEMSRAEGGSSEGASLDVEEAAKPTGAAPTESEDPYADVPCTD